MGNALIVTSVQTIRVYNHRKLEKPHKTKHTCMYLKFVSLIVSSQGLDNLNLFWPIKKKS